MHPVGEPGLHQAVEVLAAIGYDAGSAANRLGLRLYACLQASRGLALARTGDRYIPHRNNR